MATLTRRTMLKNAALSIGGTFALPTLAAAVQSRVHRIAAQTEDHRYPHCPSPRAWTANARAHLHRPRDYGQGESTDAAVGTASLVNQFRRLLVGQDPLNVDALWERIRTSGIFAGAQGGQYVTALTGVEIALWDVAGKALGLPIYQLLGGKFRDQVRMYCDSDMDDPMGAGGGQEAPWIKDQGFTAMKIDLDDATDPPRFDKVNWTASNGEIDRMVTWVRHMRESIPKEMELACDMHGRYDAAPESMSPRHSSLSACCGWRSRYPPKTLTPWRISATRRRLPSLPARIFTCAGDFGNCSEKRRRYHHA